jgi:hypothetical protein
VTSEPNLIGPGQTCAGGCRLATLESLGPRARPLRRRLSQESGWALAAPIALVALVLAVLGLVTPPLSSGMRDGTVHVLNLVLGNAAYERGDSPGPKPITADGWPSDKPIHNASFKLFFKEAWRRGWDAWQRFRERWRRRGERRPRTLDELERGLRRRLNELEERLATLEREARADARRLRDYPFEPGLADRVARRTADRVVESNRLAREHNRIMRELDQVRRWQRRRNR